MIDGRLRKKKMKTPKKKYYFRSEALRNTEMHIEEYENYFFLRLI